MDVDVRLTDLVSSGGCAAKYSASRLQELLRGFVPAEEEDLLVGLDPADDAAVYRLDDERAQRRLRDGRRPAARVVRRRVPRGAADRDGARGVRRGRAPGARGGRAS